LIRNLSFVLRHFVDSVDFLLANFRVNQQIKRGMAETKSQPVSVVTGGAGFLGSHLADRLLAEGHRVTAHSG
jgi:hypothetical protein